MAGRDFPGCYPAEFEKYFLPLKPLLKRDSWPQSLGHIHGSSSTPAHTLFALSDICHVIDIVLLSFFFSELLSLLLVNTQSTGVLPILTPHHLCLV